MAALDTRLPLAGRGPDVMNALMQGTQAASAANQTMRQNALAQLYREQGPGIMAGEQGALNALATMNPETALGVQSTRLGMDATRQNMDIQRQNLEITRRNAAMEAAEFARTLSAEQREAAQTQIASIQETLMSAQTPEQYAALVQRFQQQFPDLDLSGSTWDSRMQDLAILEGSIDGLAVQSIKPIPSADTTEADREIARLTGIGVPYDTAVKIKEGVYKTVTDPTTKETIIVDLATNEQVGVIAPQGAGGPGADGEQVEPPQPDLTFGPAYQGAPSAFGVEGAFRGAANRVADVVPGINAPFPETMQAQRDFDVLREKIIADIANGYQRQPPSWLMRNIQDLTPRAGTPFMGAGEAQAKLRALGRDMQQEIEQTEQDMRRRLSPTDRANLEARLAGLRAALGRVGSALEAFRPAVVEVSPEDDALIDKYLRSE